MHIHYRPAGVQGVADALPPYTIIQVDDAPNVILETIKRSDDDKFDGKKGSETNLVLRLYETFGGHAKAKLRM